MLKNIYIYIYKILKKKKKKKVLKTRNMKTVIGIHPLEKGIEKDGV
jgi:hypothetical protein